MFLQTVSLETSTVVVNYVGNVSRALFRLISVAVFNFTHPPVLSALLLDYCNSLLSGSPKHLLDKLQKVQNFVARLVSKARKHEHIKRLL